MQSFYKKEIYVFFTPEELRRLANDAEAKLREGLPGESLVIEVISINKYDLVNICAEQR